jgi:hypothetical protein
MKKMSASMRVCLLAASVAVAVVRGWVLSILWGWFITGPFGIRPLSVVLAMGIMLTAALVAESGISDETNRALEERPFAYLVERVVVSVIILGFGTIYHAVM